MNEIFLDLMDLLKGLLLMGTAAMVHVWADIYPVLTATTALVAFIVAMHSFFRLAYRWFKGINTISSKDDPS